MAGSRPIDIPADPARPVRSADLYAYEQSDPEKTARTALGQLLRGRIRNAIQGNEIYLETVTPTAGQVRTQVDLLTRQVTVLIRLALGDDLLDESGK